MVINHGQAMTIHNFWSEPSNVDGPPDPDTDGYMLRIVNSSSVKVTGNLVLVRSENKIQVLNSNVILDAFIDAEQYYPNRSDWLEVDSNSKVTMPFQTTSQNSLRISDPDAKTRDVKLEFNTFGGLWTIRPNAGGGNRFGIIDIFNEEVLSILSGNIGIGTTVPDTALSIRKGNQLFAIGGSGSAYSEISLLLPSGAVGNSRSVIAEGSGTTPRLTFGGGYEGLYGTTFEVRTDISRAGSAGTGYPNLGQALVVKRTSQDGTTNDVLSTIGVTKLYPLTSDGIQLATWDAGPPSLTVSKATGNVGIGTTSPNAKLQVVDGDAAVTTQGNGLILRATNGANCFRLTVNNAGTLSTTAIACP
ncbi:hypothetical protein HYW99_03930 [Candidatus Woesearchaeota archaeon]|nr:hypothetical protein [Candidatus Woesearchaeota archaeon]